MNSGLSVGLGLNLSSGKPLTPLAANPNYTSGGEIPTAPRASVSKRLTDSGRVHPSRVR